MKGIRSFWLLLFFGSASLFSESNKISDWVALPFVSYTSDFGFGGGAGAFYFNLEDSGKVTHLGLSFFFSTLGQQQHFLEWKRQPVKRKTIRRIYIKAAYINSLNATLFPKGSALNDYQTEEELRFYSVKRFAPELEMTLLSKQYFKHFHFSASLLSRWFRYTKRDGSILDNGESLDLTFWGQNENSLSYLPEENKRLNKSALAAAMLHDSRNSSLMPETGRFVFFQNVSYLFQNDKNNLINLQWTEHYQLGEGLPFPLRHSVLASRLNSQTLLKDDFTLYPRYGGPLEGRGFPLDRFFDRSKLSTSLEWRLFIRNFELFDSPWSFWFNTFLDYGGVFPDWKKLSPSNLHASYGGELLISWQKQQHLALTLAQSPEQNSVVLDLRKLW